MEMCSEQVSRRYKLAYGRHETGVLATYVSHLIDQAKPALLYARPGHHQTAAATRAFESYADVRAIFNAGFQALVKFITKHPNLGEKNAKRAIEFVELTRSKCLHVRQSRESEISLRLQLFTPRLSFVYSIFCRYTSPLQDDGERAGYTCASKDADEAHDGRQPFVARGFREAIESPTYLTELPMKAAGSGVNHRISSNVLDRLRYG